MALLYRPAPPPLQTCSSPSSHYTLLSFRDIENISFDYESEDSLRYPDFSIVDEIDDVRSVLFVNQVKLLVNVAVIMMR